MYEMEIQRDTPWSWRLLQPHELPEFTEVVSPADYLSEWICLHCAELDLGQKQVAIAHAQSKCVNISHDVIFVLSVPLLTGDR